MKNGYKRVLIDGGPLWSKVYKRSVIFGDESLNKDCKVFPENIYYTEDNAVGASIILKVKRLAYIPEPLHFYLIRQGSASHSISERHIRERWLTSHMILDTAQKEGNLQKYPMEFESIFSSLFCVNTLNYIMPHIFQGKKELVKSIITEQKRLFPNFENNLYYQRRVSSHDRGWIHLLTEIL